MILKKVSIANYLSITKQVEIDLDKRATILLGANDHGKSNILKAILCLNEDTPIGAQDANWDSQDGTMLRFDFELSKNECDALISAAKQDALDNPKDDAPLPNDGAEARAEQSRRGTVLLLSLGIVCGEQSGTLSLTRTGVDAPLCLHETPLKQLSPRLAEAIRKSIPRAELFSTAVGELQDSVTAAQIATEPFEFLQGVFFYAGIDPLAPETNALFKQDDRTERKLDEASVRLDNELRKLWAQGVDLDLHFQLRHRQGSIEFLANDPAVKTQKARMSKRSAGVTQFFRLSMALHARRKKHPSNSYIYLFDEPGVFLHPKGQKDLIQVFEQLADEAQIIYATHSLFMLNQNFPERHRLIVRDEAGTRIDHKPYRANWRLATDALGIHLTANILFSPAILLVEGDSDPLYLYELFRQLNQIGALDADANMLGILSYNAEAPTLRFLLQTFKGDNRSAKVTALYDGDKAGRALKKASRELCARLEVQMLELENGKSIEDYILYEEIFLEAVHDTIKLAASAENVELPADLNSQLASKWEQSKESDAVTRGKWFKDVSKEFLKKEEASKVALARTYVFKCRERQLAEPHGMPRERALELCRRIAEELSLPSIKAKKEIEG
jgi:predicted ATPase